MSYKIGVVSPSRRQGETTITMLLGLALEKATDGTVCITATGSDYVSMRTYLGVSETDDVTRSTSQLTQLLESGAVSREGFKDYLTPVTPKTDVLLSSSRGMSEIEGDRLLRNALPYLTHDFILTDINSGLDSDIVHHIFDTYDFILVAFSQDIVVRKKLETWMASGAFPDRDKTGFVLNFFYEEVGPAKPVAKELGINFNTKFAKLSASPALRKMENEGKIAGVLPYIINKDSRVLELFYDLENILSMLSANLAFPIKWGE